MVLTVFFVLFPVTGFLATVIGGSLRQLDASVGASEPHVFAVREARAFVFRAACVHRIPPRVRDDREPPLCGTGRRVLEMIWGKREEEYFCAKGWTGQPLICPPGTHRECGSQSVRLRFHWNLSMNRHTCHAAAPPSLSKQ